jgi:hypothetical protein
LDYIFSFSFNRGANPSDIISCKRSLNAYEQTTFDIVVPSPHTGQYRLSRYVVKEQQYQKWFVHMRLNFFYKK